MRRVILCGLGAVGLTYAVKLKNSDNIELKILVDKARRDKYEAVKPLFNGEEQNFDYILPDETFEPDLIIISTKSQGLESVLGMIKNFVTPKTRIISLINGISSERIISETYPQAKVLKSYFIGHSAIREGNSVTQDGENEIVCEKDEVLEEIFKTSDINYSIPKDMDYSMWLKFTLNVFSNQTSAILKMNFGEMSSNRNFMEFAKKIITEVKEVASKVGINGLENLENDCFKIFSRMSGDGKTSMYQDILAKRPTEVDIFAGEIIRLGKKYGVETPYNQVLYDLIKIEEERNEHSLHTCKSGK